MRDKPEKTFVDFLIICQVGDVGNMGRAHAPVSRKGRSRVELWWRVLRRVWHRQKGVNLVGRPSRAA
jgi:hypothetical protein